MNLKQYWYFIPIALFFIVSAFFSTIINFYVDLLWFKSVGYFAVFWTIFSTRIMLFGASLLLIFAFIYMNLFIAQKAVKKMPVLLKDNIIDMNIEGFDINVDLIKKWFNKLLALGAFVLSFMIALGFATRWNLYLKHINSTMFGKVDPLFGKDISFYVFNLPFIKAVFGIAVSIIVLTFMGTAVYYMFHKGVGFSSKGLKLTKTVEVHLSVLAAGFFCLMAYGTKLLMFDLLFSGRGIIYGAGFTDINATLPILWLTLFINLSIAALFLFNIVSSDLKRPLYGIGLLLFISVFGSGIYAGIVQRLYVSPNEIVKESPYIKHNIEFTRAAYKLDAVEKREFSVDDRLAKSDLAKNETTVRNIRLWDHRPLLSTYAQLQEIRTYYQFVDVDIDRYKINGKDTQVMLSPRELSYAKLPSKIWINEHLTYTHGYGVALSPVNVVKPGGLPALLVKDIPPVSIPELKIDRPEIYYGEIANDYVFVNTKSKEFDYPMGDKNKYTEYEGTGGIKIGSIWRKMLFAMKFSNMKILMSSDIKNDSSIMMHRRVVERIGKIVPFLGYDKDPYMVIADGKLYWILDGYSLTDMYPYSDPTGSMNYIRNSVKVVVNAYDGKVNFYVTDKDDPIVKTYSKIFPRVFESLEDMPANIRTHIRYPESMFTVQMHKYRIYHMTNPQVFYNKEDVWDIAKETFQNDVRVIPPYYTIMRLPEEKKEEFILMIPYTPTKKDNMSAWMCARSDGDEYGKLIVYLFPKKKLVYGPMQIEARIDQTPEISRQLSLWSQRGSSVIRGNTLVIPIENSLLYVEPLYLKADRGQLPELKRVIVAFRDQIAMEATLEDSLNVIFGSGSYRRSKLPSVSDLKGTDPSLKGIPNPQKEAGVNTTGAAAVVAGVNTTLLAVPTIVPVVILKAAAEAAKKAPNKKVSKKDLENINKLAEKVIKSKLKVKNIDPNSLPNALKSGKLDNMPIYSSDAKSNMPIYTYEGKAVIKEIVPDFGKKEEMPAVTIEKNKISTEKVDRKTKNTAKEIIQSKIVLKYELKTIPKKVKKNQPADIKDIRRFIDQHIAPPLLISPAADPSTVKYIVENIQKALQAMKVDTVK